jgi:protein HIRA/HIR1
MHFTKPEWVIHKDSAKSDQNTKRLSIFSVHVHPDGSRIATGGLDAKIRIWSTKPILNEASELSGKPPKSLCTLTMHTGPVLTVRWAHSGKWLASGSDDETVMVWDHDPYVVIIRLFLVLFSDSDPRVGMPAERFGDQMRSMLKVGNP